MIKITKAQPFDPIDSIEAIMEAKIYDRGVIKIPDAALHTLFTEASSVTVDGHIVTRDMLYNALMVYKAERLIEQAEHLRDCLLNR